MQKRRQKLTVIIVTLALVVFIPLLIVLPPVPSIYGSFKPVILYYDYENLPFNATQFPGIVNSTLQHHFNVLMLVVYFDHKMIFNQSTIEYFYSYSISKNLTFVPSYYIESLTDRFNVSGFPWVNLDLERIAPNRQSFFYTRVEAQSSGMVSVTSPYAQPVYYSPPIDIVETYSSTPWFWFLQLGYWHPGHICSVASWLVKSQQEYDFEKNYCLKYTGGVMVFDYSNLLKSHLN